MKFALKLVAGVAFAVFGTFAGLSLIAALSLTIGGDFNGAAFGFAVFAFCGASCAALSTFLE